MREHRRRNVKKEKFGGLDREGRRKQTYETDKRRSIMKSKERAMAGLEIDGRQDGRLWEARQAGRFVVGRDDRP